VSHVVSIHAVAHPHTRVSDGCIGTFYIDVRPSCFTPTTKRRLRPLSGVIIICTADLTSVCSLDMAIISDDLDGAAWSAFIESVAPVAGLR